MTPADALDLLARAAAFDNRTVGRADAEAWAAALADVPLDGDTLAAVARYYGQPGPDTETGRRRWIEPHHVRHHRRAIRDARLGDTLPPYEPMRPDETGADYVARRRAQIQSIADGRRPRPAIAELATAAPLAITASTAAAYMPPWVRDQLATGAPTAARPELAVACPWCHAGPGQPCTRGRGVRLRETHPARRAAHTAA
jgi:hypothetical protein